MTTDPAAAQAELDHAAPARPVAATGGAEPDTAHAELDGANPAAANRAPARARTDGASRATAQAAAAGALNATERRQLGRVRRWGTAGALLMMVGASSSYGAATPIPNPLDGIRVIGLLSRIGPAALACSYAGIGLLVLCWFLVGRFTGPHRARRLSRTQLTHTLAMWAVPLLVTPPIFSRDVYSYLAVGAMMQHGDNPYASGPYDALGDGNAFAHQVDERWQHTPTPYGPAFLLIARLVVTLSGGNVIAGVLIQRVFELIGVALIVWALPRLASRCGVDPVAALWLGALNPLLLFHLVAGGHNEALMLGAMLAGLVVALDHSVLGGTALITIGVAVKATAALALPFLVIMLALRAGGRWRDLGREGIRVAVPAAAVFALLTWAAGFGVGWVSGLGAPGTVHSFLSVTTTLGTAAGGVGVLLGLGDHTNATIGVMQPLGTAIGLLLALAIMWRCWRRSLPPLLGLGLAFGALVLLGPVIQPWYLLWAVLVLAAATDRLRYHRVTIWLTVIFSVIIMPNGMTVPVFTIVQAAVVATVVAGGVLLILRRSGLPQANPVD